MLCNYQKCLLSVYVRRRGRASHPQFHSQSVNFQCGIGKVLIMETSGVASLGDGPKRSIVKTRIVNELKRLRWVWKQIIQARPYASYSTFGVLANCVFAHLVSSFVS